MSILVDDIEPEVATRKVLERILEQLILLNDRVEEAFDTGIELGDIDDEN